MFLGSTANKGTMTKGSMLLASYGLPALHWSTSQEAKKMFSSFALAQYAIFVYREYMMYGHCVNSYFLSLKQFISITGLWKE